MVWADEARRYESMGHRVAKAGSELAICAAPGASTVARGSSILQMICSESNSRQTARKYYLF